MTTYKLDQPYRIVDDSTDRAEGGCVFCGKVTQHFNDGGAGWILEAKDDQGRMGQYLYCSHPMCQQAEDNDAAEIHRCYNPGHTYVVMEGQDWKLDPTQVYDSCDDFGSYIEFLGDRCPECNGLVAEVDARLYDPRWAKFFAAKK